MATTPFAPTPSVTAEPVTGNSLTQFLRSIGNQAGATAGTDTTAGQNTFGQGIQQLDPAISYFSKLLGSNSDLTSALEPQLDPISQQFDNIRNAISSSQPRGGGTASTFAQAPFQEAATKAQIAQQARSQAATGLTTAATDEAGLGAQEQGIGLQALGESLQEGLGRENIDTGQGSFGSQFDQVSQGLATLI
jgi:hypothetical protein